MSPVIVAPSIANKDINPHNNAPAIKRVYTAEPRICLSVGMRVNFQQAIPNVYKPYVNAIDNNIVGKNPNDLRMFSNMSDMSRFCPAFCAHAIEEIRKGVR